MTRPPQQPTTGPVRPRPDPARPPARAETRPEHVLRAHAEILAAAEPAAAPAERAADPLAALKLLGDVRSSLDETERQLIEAARRAGSSWGRIAGALGLASRQAAEQRWLRLTGGGPGRDPGRDPARLRATRERQRSVDDQYGAAVRELRAAVIAIHRELGAAPGWDELHPSARLARTTLALAAQAEGGGLFALASQAADDLTGVPIDRLPAWSTPLLDRLRQAILAATPSASSSRIRS